MRPAATLAMAGQPPCRPAKLSGTEARPAPGCSPPQAIGAPNGTQVLEPGLDLVAHLRRHGRARFRGAALIEQAEAAGLTGRGGAAFPVATKLSAVAAVAATRCAVS